VAGSTTTVRFTYTCGHPIDDSGAIKITFRSTSDVGAPQFDDPTGVNYCTVSTTGDCHIEPRWDPKGHVRPWSRALFLKIRGGFLNQGETITVIFGDTAQGSPGWQMQTSYMDRFEFKTFADPIATYQFKELPDSPVVELIPGEPVRALCIAPSQVVAEQPFAYSLKLEDRWGNPTDLPQKHLHPGFTGAGVQTLLAEDGQTGLAAVSNPINVLGEGDAAGTGLFWADFHGQSGETVGDGTIERYFTFARDFGLLDIAGHQGNDFQITDEFWQRINQTTRRFYEPGRFVTFPGYEWSGNTPLGGDRNVFFASEGGEIVRSSNELLPGNRSAHPVAPTAQDLFRTLSEQSDPQPFCFAHVGGRYADIAMHDPALERAVEVHSAWGTFEWMLEEAFQRGYRVGICANSDGHKCRPGASYPGAGKFGSLGGLTCVLASALDRESVVDALRARHFYATTGHRPLVSLGLTGPDRTFTMGDIVEMGAEMDAGSYHLHGRVVGTGPIDHVEIRNGMGVLKRIRPYGQDDLGRRIKIVWRGARVRGRDRLVNWDGTLDVAGNAIEAATPLNFWNANAPLVQSGPHHLAWQSVTTGGTTGVILTLSDPDAGSLRIRTTQGAVDIDIAAIGMAPTTWAYGGIQKEISVSRLPDQQTTHQIAFDLPLADLSPTDLHDGDNPIYLHVVQEDEQMAWTSPIYLVL
jgi:hypothetical protein